MKAIAVVVGIVLALFPNIRYLVGLRYSVDPVLGRSVCRNVACSDELLLASAERLAGRSREDVAVALENLEEALRRNVASPYRWCDVGEALLAAGRIEEARYCFIRAVELGPQISPVLWRTAQFYIQVHEPNRRQQYMGKMLELLPEYKELVFDAYFSSRGNVSDTLEHGFSPQSPLAKDYFRYLLVHATLEDVKKAWDWLKGHSIADDPLAGEYVDLLIKKGEYLLAVDTWKRTAGHYDNAYLRPNLVFNGDFESQPLQSGLDWRFPETPGVGIKRDSTVAFSGSSSLQIEFDGERNIDFRHLTHDVVAPPGHYHFRALVRTSELTTDQGIRFRLVDSSGRLNLETTQLTGTHDWTPVDLDFTLAGPVRLLRIEVVRQPSAKFDNKIRGHAWVDSVSLVRL